jgi:hypothetical protein
LERQKTQNMAAEQPVYLEAEAETLFSFCSWDGPASEELVDTDTTPKDRRQTKTSELTLLAPGAGLLQSFPPNNLNSTWRAKLLIK